MALTDLERVSVFEVLGVPSSAKIYTFDSFLGAGRQASTIAIQSSISAIDELISLLTAAQETRLKAYIVSWDEISTDAVSLTDGGATVAPGARYSSAEERNLIRERVLNLVPGFRTVLWQLRQAGGDLGVTSGGQIRRG